MLLPLSRYFYLKMDSPRPSILLQQVRLEDGSNASEGVERKLVEMGATIKKSVSSECTHLIFRKGGSRLQYDRAMKYPCMHIVNVLWVDACWKEQKHVDEAPFSLRANNCSENKMNFVVPSLMFSSRKRSMEPKALRQSDVANRPEMKTPTTKRPLTQAQSCPAATTPSEAGRPVDFKLADPSDTPLPSSKRRRHAQGSVVVCLTSFSIK